MALTPENRWTFIISRFDRLTYTWIPSILIQIGKVIEVKAKNETSKPLAELREPGKV